MWNAIQKGVTDLVENRDVIENERSEYIVGYLFKMTERRKATVLPQLGKAESLIELSVGVNACLRQLFCGFGVTGLA